MQMKNGWWYWHQIRVYAQILEELNFFKHFSAHATWS